MAPSALGGEVRFRGPLYPRLAQAPAAAPHGPFGGYGDGRDRGSPARGRSPHREEAGQCPASMSTQRWRALSEAAFLVIDEGLHDLLPGVHHERTMAGHRLAQRT